MGVRITTGSCAAAGEPVTPGTDEDTSSSPSLMGGVVTGDNVPASAFPASAAGVVCSPGGVSVGAIVAVPEDVGVGVGAGVGVEVNLGVGVDVNAGVGPGVAIPASPSPEALESTGVRTGVSEGADVDEEVSVPPPTPAVG